MEQYVRFWRYLPRFTLGACFLFISFANLIKINDVSVVFDLLVKQQNGSLQGLFSTALLAISITAACAGGLFALEIVVSVVGIASVYIFKAPLLRVGIDAIGLSDIISPINQVSKRIFIRYSAQIISFYRLRSLSVPGMLEKTPLIDTHWESISGYLAQIDDQFPLPELAYYTALTQEQVSIRRMQDSVLDIYYACAVISMSYITYIHLADFLSLGTMLFTVIVPTTIIILLFVARDRKRALAAHLLFSFIDNFTNADFAQIADRESF